MGLGLLGRMGREDSRAEWNPAGRGRREPTRRLVRSLAGSRARALVTPAVVRVQVPTASPSRMCFFRCRLLPAAAALACVPRRVIRRGVRDCGVPPAPKLGRRAARGVTCRRRGMGGPTDGDRLVGLNWLDRHGSGTGGGVVAGGFLAVHC